MNFHQSYFPLNLTERDYNRIYFDFRNSVIAHFVNLKVALSEDFVISKAFDKMVWDFVYKNVQAIVQKEKGVLADFCDKMMVLFTVRYEYAKCLDSNEFLKIYESIAQLS
jgi:hypothetical protein